MSIIEEINIRKKKKYSISEITKIPKHLIGSTNWNLEEDEIILLLLTLTSKIDKSIRLQLLSTLAWP